MYLGGRELLRQRVFASLRPEVDADARRPDSTEAQAAAASGFAHQAHGTILGRTARERRIHLIHVADRRSHHGGRAGGILSVRGAEVSLGSFWVGSGRVQAPTPHAPALQAFLVDFSQQTTRFSHLLATVCWALREH